MHVVHFIEKNWLFVEFFFFFVLKLRIMGIHSRIMNFNLIDQLTYVANIWIVREEGLTVCCPFSKYQS